MSRLPMLMVLAFLCFVTFLPARPMAASTAAVPSGDQEQRALIQCIIENQLSSAGCKAVVQSQNTDPNQDLLQACSMLETGKSMMPLVGCTMDDYDKLHKVICEYNTAISCVATTSTTTTGTTTIATTTTPTTTPTATASTTTPTITTSTTIPTITTSTTIPTTTTTNLPTTTTASKHATTPTTTNLPATTTAPIPITTPTITTTSTYTTASTTTSTLTTTSTPTTTTTTRPATITTPTITITTTLISTATTVVAPAMTDEEEQRELILCVIENQLSNEQCKSVVNASNSDPNLDLQQACSMLEAGKSMISLAGCTMDDYNKLHKVICEYNSTDTAISCIASTSMATRETVITTTTITPTRTPTTTASAMSDDQKQRELILCVIENQLSNEQCKSAVKIQNTDPNLDLRQACLLLETGKNMISVINCTMDDYNKLHEVICEYNTTDIDISCITNTPTPPTSITATTTIGTTSAATSTTKSCTITANMTDDQKRRALIECVIENDLSSERCRSLVKSQNSNPNQDLQEACSMLEAGKSMMPLVGCTMDDYDKLHKAICEYQTGITMTPTMTDEEKQRALILCVIENQLSNEECTSVVNASNSDPNLDLQQACSMLEAGKSMISLAGCTLDDYNKLHQVICEYNSTGRDISCTTNLRPATTSVPITVKTTAAPPPTITEKEQIEKVQAMIQNELSSTQCKDILQSQLTPDLTLAKGCELLEQYQSAFPFINCTVDDYAKLHKEVCEFSVDSDTSCDPDLPRWRDEVRDVMDNHLSAQCGPLVKEQVDDTATPQESCEMLLENKDSMMVICTQEDYVAMHDILCTYENRSLEMKKDRLGKVLQKVGSSCKRSVLAIVNQDIGGECERITISRNVLLSSRFCTGDQMTEIEDNVCNKGSVCRAVSNNLDSRQSRVEASIKVLSETCQRTMGPGIQELREPSEKSCKILEDRKDHLISSGACTEVDYARLYLVVCSDRGSEGNQQIEKVISFLNNNLTVSCHGRLWPKVESLAQGLESMCEYLKTIGPILLRVGDCSKTEYNKLDSLLCPRPMSEQEKAQRDEIDRVVAEDVTPSCKSTMEGQIESQRNQPLEESCDLIKGSKDLLSSFCTPEDIVKLESAICGEGGDSASALTGNLLAIVPLFVMSWVSTYVLM